MLVKDVERIAPLPFVPGILKVPVGSSFVFVW
jgi:hypothetical protein